MRKVKHWNSQVFIELTCYVAFAAAMLYLIFSGNYLSYVTPRMKPYLYFTAAVMVVWALCSLSSLSCLQYRKRTAHCFILVIPVLLLFLPHGAMGMASLSGSTGLLTGSAAGGPAGTGGAETAPVLSAPPGETPGAPTADAQEPSASDGYLSQNIYGEPLEIHGYDEKNKTITVSNDEFYNWLSAFFTNLDRFEGYQVTMTGAVYKNTPVLSEDEFVPARLVMSCCVADLEPAGIVCNYDKTADLQSGEWVTVTGTLYRGRYEGRDEPQIKVTSIEPAEPVEGYIYPYP